MKRQHEMPFGAECRPDGSVRFRLWAPKAAAVNIRLCGSHERELAMNAVGEGWFELTTSEARAGSRYQFRVDEQHLVPDPASRFQPDGAHGPSELVDPTTYDWHDADWRGRPWEEAIIYELHVGTFTPEGTFTSAERKLDYLAELGVTAIEIMPVATCPGQRNWGYDGVLPYAPASAYGRPEDFKHFVDAAHARKMMVLLDVVYNHFGPEGNYLPLYAPQFFTDRHETPWGQAINFDGPCSRPVREFFIHNALYWLEEYHFDGLRFDAVHAIKDDSHPDILEELAARVHATISSDRQVHLVLENDDNAAHYLCRAFDDKPRFYTAQWDDDIHHAAHVIITGETDGYYADYADDPAWHLARCLAEGFSYQGESSAYRQGRKRGESSRDLPPTAFVAFLQNHDQVGNRAFGERIGRFADPAALRAAMTVLLLAPSPPLLFMGEEFNAATPFLFFCDFGPDLAPKVTEGRRSEFARFAQFSSSEAQARIPDPGSEKTFLSSKLDWESITEQGHREWLEFYRELLAIRKREILQRIPQIIPGGAKFQTFGKQALAAAWPLKDGGNLHLVTNFADRETRIPEAFTRGRVLRKQPENALSKAGLAPRSAVWMLNE